MAKKSQLITFEKQKPQLHKSAFVAPGALLIGDVSLGENSSVWFGAIVRADIYPIKVGKASNIQDGTIVHVTAGKYPVIIGDKVSIAHAVMIHGCVIEDECLIGMRSTILDGAKIGHHSIVAAGALVTEGMQVPPYSVVMGVPGKVVRKVRPDELVRIEKNWQHYIDYSKRWKKQR
jgi:gamma-carbonic anhydrase